MSVTFQQVNDAIKFVESHHFRGTTLVVCCISMADGRTVLGMASTPRGASFDITEVASSARASANAQVAKELEANPLQPETAN